jgi:hypothetical protein
MGNLGVFLRAEFIWQSRGSPPSQRSHYWSSTFRNIAVDADAGKFTCITTSWIVDEYKNDCAGAPGGSVGKLNDNGVQ